VCCNETIKQKREEEKKRIVVILFRLCFRLSIHRPTFFFFLSSALMSKEGVCTPLKRHFNSAIYTLSYGNIYLYDVVLSK